MDFTDLRIMKTQEKLQNALLDLLKTKELKEITVKEICDSAGISRNAFYQHYGYKEDLYDQMVARATEGIRDSLTPIIPDSTHLNHETMTAYTRHVIDGIAEVRELIRVMLKGDNGIFLRQLTDLIYGQNLSQALEFFSVEDSYELHLFYEFLSAGEAAFIIKLIMEDSISKEKAIGLLSEILSQLSSYVPLL